MLPLSKQQEQVFFSMYGLWFVITIIDTMFHLAWITLPLAGLELLAGIQLLRHGVIGHVWPWYGCCLLLLGLVTLIYAWGGIDTPELILSTGLLYLILFVSSLGLFAVFVLTLRTRWGMRQLGAPALDKLLRSLASTAMEDRAIAAVLLGRLRDSRAVDALINVLADPDSSVRAKAAVALGYIGDPRALPALQHITQDDYVDDVEYPTKYVAATAIKRIQTRKHKQRFLSK